MSDWQAFARAAPDIARAGRSLFELNEVAFLATVTHAGRPRLHPFVPKIVDGRLVAFIMAASPKIRDLRSNGHYVIHALPGAEDEEFHVGGSAQEIADEPTFRSSVASIMGFATGIDDQHVLFEFLIENVLWTRWLDFGTSHHRPLRQGWNHHRGLLSFQN